jgi:site-specific recombinase XerD
VLCVRKQEPVLADKVYPMSGGEVGIDSGEDRTRNPEDAGSSPAASTRKRKKRRLPKIVSAAEARRLLVAAEDGSDVGLRNRLMLELMYRAGLRVGELITLRPRDVERAGIIRLYDAKGGDGTAYFDVERLQPSIDAWLIVRERWIRGAGDLGDFPFFVRPDGRPVTVRYVQRLVTRLKEETGIRGRCTPHVLRHTFATELLEEGFSIIEVQSALRHASVATTQIYLHIRDEALRNKIQGRR